MSELARAGVRGFRQVDEVVWELPAGARADMRVPARVFADRELIGQIAADRSLEQLQNVATLPGICGAALAMPDIHQGYGFPVGGVAATELPDGVVSPGGVGYDINCGVRLLALPLTGAGAGRSYRGARARDLPARAGRGRARRRAEADRRGV
jgi:tRNA-splicing ligase RtcB (3'-phosphate/5'-hydroxy nucleic acid ligase)